MVNAAVECCPEERPVSKTCCFLIHLLHWIWHQVPSGSSPKSKWLWEINALNQCRTLRQPWWFNQQHSHKRAFRMLQKWQEWPDKCVWNEGNILQGINGNCFYCNFIKIKCSLYFWSYFLCLLCSRNCNFNLSSYSFPSIFRIVFNY